MALVFLQLRSRCPAAATKSIRNCTGTARLEPLLGPAPAQGRVPSALAGLESWPPVQGQVLQVKQMRAGTVAGTCIGGPAAMPTRAGRTIAQQRLSLSPLLVRPEATWRLDVNAFAQHRHPQTLQLRHFHSTTSALQANKDAEKAQPSEAELAETQETVPEWQNPLHHNSAEMNKMFEEDFQEGQPVVPAPLPPFETDPEKVVAPPHVHDLAHRIVNLTLLELKQLTEKIAKHFDFDDEVMAANYSGGAALAATSVAPQEEKQEEKVIFDLKLVGFDAKAKIKVIKEIRAIAGLGLKEAKELVESAPKVFQKDLKQDKAEELKAQLEAVGAQVEVV